MRSSTASTNVSAAARTACEDASVSDSLTCPICTMPEPLVTDDGFECATCGHEWLAEPGDGIGGRGILIKAEFVRKA